MKKNNILLSIVLTLLPLTFVGMDDVAAVKRVDSSGVVPEHESIEQMKDRHEEELRQLDNKRMNDKVQALKESYRKNREVRAAQDRNELTSDQASLQLDRIKSEREESHRVIDSDYDDRKRSMQLDHQSQLELQDPQERVVHEKYLQDKTAAEKDHAERSRQIEDNWGVEDTAISKRTDLDDDKKKDKYDQNDRSALNDHERNNSEHQARLKGLQSTYESDLADVRSKKQGAVKMENAFQDALEGVDREAVTDSSKSFDEMDHKEKKEYLKKRLPESVMSELTPDQVEKLVDFSAKTDIDSDLLQDNLTDEQKSKLKQQVDRVFEQMNQALDDPEMQEIFDKPSVKKYFEGLDKTTSLDKTIKDVISSSVDRFKSWGKSHKLMLAGIVAFVVLAIMGAAQS